MKKNITNDILYLSSACSEKEYATINVGIRKLVSQQSTKFNRLFAEGFAQNNYDITMLSSRPINTNVHPKKMFKGKVEVENGVKYKYLSFYNYKYIRHIMIMINAFCYIKKWCKKHPNGYIFCDVLNFTLLYTLGLVTKKTNNKIIGIITDLPEMFKGVSIKKIKKHNELISKCDYYVVLANDMKYKLPAKNKPIVVVEGFCDIDMDKHINILENKYKEKVVLYAGLINKEYGIQNLTEAFIDANITNTELHIYGPGDYEEELKSITRLYPNIKYFGSKPNDYVVQEQLKATLLVNPRPTNEEFVKYSFPSKNMEYIVSGTPMLTTDLPSMPAEYKDYCFVAKDYSKDGLEKELKKILLMPKEELHSFGLKAKAWSLNNKNNKVQADKVLKMLEYFNNEYSTH